MSAHRILLVEDSPSMSRMISSLLKGECYEVEAAVDGKAGLARAQASRPDLVLVDFDMPELDGVWLCREMKADKELRSIPVVVLARWGESETTAQAVATGVTDYIRMPNSPDETSVLFARIRSALRIAELQRELAERNRLLEAAQMKLRFMLDLARRLSR